MVVAPAQQILAGAANPDGGLLRLLAILALAASLLALPAAASAREEGEASGSDTESTDTEQSPQPGAEKPEAEPATPEPPEQAEATSAPQSPKAPVGEPDEARDAAAAEVADAATAATAESVPVERSPQPEPAPVAEDTPDSSALAALRHALDQVSVLQRLLAEGHDGESPIPGQSELDDIRRALQDSLVEVARFEQSASLRQWLEGEGLKAALAEVERSANSEVVAAEVEPEPEVASAIDAKRLRGVTRAIEDAPFKEGKMALLTDQLQNVRLRAEQVGELIDLFAFSSDKVEALVFLYPRLVDPERFEVLLSSLKFKSDRLSVRQRLGLGGS
jgi:hypothetical protein